VDTICETYQRLLYKLYIADALSKKHQKEALNHYIRVRHLFNLPIRGQRTHTNAKTRKKHLKKINK
jgi:ribosomal protein S13